MTFVLIIMAFIGLSDPVVAKYEMATYEKCLEASRTFSDNMEKSDKVQGYSATCLAKKESK